MAAGDLITESAAQALAAAIAADIDGLVDPAEGVLGSSLSLLTALAEDDTSLVWDTSASELKQLTIANLRLALARQGMPITNVVASDVANSTVTAANVTGQSWAVISGRRYWLKIVGTFRTAATTTGIGFNFTIPTMTSNSMRVKIRQAAAGTDAYFEGDGPMGTNIQSGSVLAATTDYHFEIEAMFQPSADGTVQLQSRSEVASSAATVRAGTVGTLIDITGTP